MSCPRCGGCIAIEVQTAVSGAKAGSAIGDNWPVVEIQSVPEAGHMRFRVDHLPDDVQRFFADAIRVMDAGVPDAAAVQLRRTLEATAAHKGIKKKTLVQSVEEMIAQGLVTKDFAEVLTHVRKIGNLGAHYTDEPLTATDVERALRFTTQFLRNVFEVPGELRELQAQEEDTESVDAPAEAWGVLGSSLEP